VKKLKKTKDQSRDPDEQAQGDRLKDPRNHGAKPASLPGHCPAPSLFRRSVEREIEHSISLLANRCQGIKYAPFWRSQILCG
jgi:hypothetical protein